MSTIRKIGNVLLLVLGVFLILTGILSAKIGDPKFQTYLADKVVGYLSNKLKTEIKIGGVDFKLFDHLVLHDVLIKDRSKDTLLYAKTVDATLGVIDLLQHRYVIKKVMLDQPNVYLHNYMSTDEFNFQFILDALGGDTTSTSSGPSDVEFDLNALAMNQTHFVMLDEPNSVKLDFHIPQTMVDVKKLDLNKSIIRLRQVIFHDADLKVAKLQRTFDPADTIVQPDTAVVHINTKAIQLYVSSLQFVNSQFQFDDEMEPYTTGQFDGFHQQYKNLNLQFSDGSLVKDSIQAKIDNISFTEKCGLEVKHMEALAKVTPTESIADHLKIETANSTAGNYFSMSYHNFHAFLNYNSEMMMKAILERSSVSIKDIAFFMPQVKSLGEKNVLTTGTFIGSVDNLKGKDLKLQTGGLTRFNGNIDIKGLPEINETYIDFKVDQLITNVQDVHQFIPNVILPKKFSRLGTVNFSGSFTGFFKDFVAYGVMNTQLGQLRSDLNMKFNESFDNATYSGNLAALKFDVGNYSGVDSLLGTMSFDAKVTGNGLSTDNLDAKLVGTVQQFQFNHYNYQNIHLDGTFNKKLFTGKVNMKDDNINLDFTGMLDLNNDLPVYNFHADIQNANLNTLQFTAKEYLLTTQLDMNMKGNNIDNFIGYAKAVHTTFSKSNDQLSLDTVSLNINEANGEKHFALTSNPGKAVFNGTFALTKLPASFLSVLDHYFPSLPMHYEAPGEAQDFDFDIVLNDVSGVLHFFFPDVHGISESTIHGHFNSLNNAIAFSGVIPSLGYEGISVDTLDLSADTKEGQFHFSVLSSDMSIGDSTKIIHPAFIANIADDSAHIRLLGANIPQNTYMNLSAIISGDTSGVRMHVLPSELVVNNARWNVSENNLIAYADERLRFYNFELRHQDQSLTITNVNLRPRATNLHFDFNKLPLADLYHFVRQNSFDIRGNLSGSMEMLNVFHAPRLQANTTIDSLVINGRAISQANLNTEYVPENDQVMVQLLLADENYDIRADGSYFPRKVSDQLNVNLDIRKFDLSFFETLLPGYFSNTDGFTNGTLLVSGNPDAPLVTGKLEIPFLSAKVDYLQTTYHVYNEAVTFNANNIDVGEMKLFDENNDVASARGQISHDHLDDFQFNLSVATDRFEGLKTTQKDNTLFYGTAEAGGLIQFLGPLDNMEIRASVTSRHGTQISIPINSGTSVADRSFIRYMKKGNDSLNYTFTSTGMIKGLRLNFDLDITPDAEIKIIFDQKAGDIIKGNGNGNIRMEIDPKGDFNMYGTYTIERGDYLFTLQNFFNKYFSIDRGGTIAWTGDPYGAQIDIDAIYSTKASVYDLVVGSGITFASDQEVRDLQRRIPVDVYLKLTGSLLLPDVMFDIRLPDETTLSSAAYQQVQKVKQDEGELNKQVFGLLILNRFLPTNSGTGNQSFGSDVNNSVSEFLLNQLSYWTSQIRSDIDFNFNYQSYEANLNTTNPNDLTKRNELEVALTKRFFNDRLALEAGGNFDFAATNTDPSAGSSGSSTNVAGDFAVEYKLTPDGRLSGKAFSKSQYDVVDERYKTKNGVALSYKREFDQLKELFRKDPDKQKRKEEREREKQQREIEKQEENNPTTSGKVN